MDDKIKVLTPVKAIRAKCLDCCGLQWSEVKVCPIKSCPLYPYRLGKRPKKDAEGNYMEGQISLNEILEEIEEDEDETDTV